MARPATATTTDSSAATVSSSATAVRANSVEERPLFDTTVNMLEMLDNRELEAIQGVAKVFIMTPNEDNPFRPLSEDELFERIDHSLAQADAGIYEDADDVVNEIIAELSL